jgi:hypothetical protein
MNLISCQALRRLAGDRIRVDPRDRRFNGLKRGKVCFPIIPGLLTRVLGAGLKTLEMLVCIIDPGAEIAAELVELFAHDNLLVHAAVRSV